MSQIKTDKPDFPILYDVTVTGALVKGLDIMKKCEPNVLARFYPWEASLFNFFVLLIFIRFWYMLSRGKPNTWIPILYVAWQQIGTLIKPHPP